MYDSIIQLITIVNQKGDGNSSPTTRAGVFCDNHHKMLGQGKHLGTQIVAAKLQGTLKTHEFFAKDKDCAEQAFLSAVHNAISVLISKRHYGELGDGSDSGKKYQIVFMLKEVEK
jgi:hypothetical protein